MNRKVIVTVTIVALFLIGLTATAVFARNSRFKDIDITLDEPAPTPTPKPKGGPKNEVDQPNLTISMHHEDIPVSDGNVVFAVGTASGLGNVADGATVNLQMEGTAVLACINHGGTKAPGQNSPPIQSDGSVAINAENITKNGNADFVVETNEPELPAGISVTDECPNKNWTLIIDYVLWDSAWVTLEQTGEEPVEAHFTCTTEPAPPAEPEQIICTEIPQ